MDGIALLDLQGNLLAHNTKLAKIWNFPGALLEQENGLTFMAQSEIQVRNREAYSRIVVKRQAEPELVAMDLIELNDGRVLERYQFPRCIEAECIGMVVNFRDVTEQKHAEAALQVSEEKYRMLWTAAGDAVLIFDRDNVILEANHALTHILGYQPHEVIGQKLSVLQPERLRAEHQATVEGFLADGSSVNRRAAETIGLHRDGREIPIEISFNRLNVDGNGMFAELMRDISERKQVEEIQGTVKAIVDSAHDAIISKTLQGIITSWNPGAEHIFGYTAEEVVGKSVLILIPPERAHEEPAILARQRLGERVDHFETVRVRKDGTRVPISLTVSPIRDSRGTIIGASKIARDITAQKLSEVERDNLLARERRAREEAEVANRTKDEFLATLSHELRTPLNAILGWAGILADDTLSEEMKTNGLQVIQRNAKLQAKLVEDVLDVSRIITGKLRLDVRPVELPEVIEAAIESVLPAARAKEIRIQRVLDSGHSLVSGDASRLQQILWNLLSNSIKFTQRGGSVQVKLQRVNSHVEIVVSDTGIGIDDTLLPYIFERFRQEDQSSTRKHGGLGLGLAIVRHLVEMHGGTVDAHSAGRGHGSTFTVKLPLAATRPGDAGPISLESSADPEDAFGDDNTYRLQMPNLCGLHVLVVDDEEDARNLIKAVLEKCDARVTAAENAREALGFLKALRPDILLSDLGMPGEDGYSLIRAVRKLPPELGGQTPAAALTAYARMEDRLKVLRAGFQIHLPKPIEPVELVTVVANLAKRV